MIPDSIKSEKRNWEIIQQEQQLAKILEKSDKKLDLSDAEEDEEISEISEKLEKNIKEIQENIDWRKNNLIIQIG